MTKRTLLTDGEKETILKLNDEKYTNVDIANILNRSDTTIGRFLKKCGRTSAFSLTAKEKDLVKTLYCEEYLNSVEIWERHFKERCNQKTIELTVKNGGYSRGQGRGNYNRNTVHDYFKEIDNSNKAYVLGYLTADGRVTGKLLRLECAKKDEEIIDFIISEICPTAVKKDYERRGHLYTVCYLGSIDIVNDLKQYNVVKGKQCANLEFPEIPKRFYPDFIRGYFDGDGTITGKVKSVDNCQGYAAFCVDEKFGVTLDKILKNEYVLTKSANNLVDMSKYGSNILSLRISRIRDVLALYEYLYYSKDIFWLDRKFQKFTKVYNQYVNTEVIKRDKAV
ncbi:hypothetical protein ACWN8V_06815 [Vagococcus elongatus]|uniref:DOD-type homing endonuclease domain-containing protein n=1 Tax=Vagococcus elongatus TaxID=180344 RepID=A0A430AW15_9ENTE|nr:helix-turn-helix domain-containing protein [Vagococcus elongatus]RSU12245.1 hypothetical protein CBF29_06505 [Vagococcus elongatus]